MCDISAGFVDADPDPTVSECIKKADDDGPVLGESSFDTPSVQAAFMMTGMQDPGTAQGRKSAATAFASEIAGELGLDPNVACEETPHKDDKQMNLTCGDVDVLLNYSLAPSSTTGQTDNSNSSANGRRLHPDVYITGIHHDTPTC